MNVIPIKTVTRFTVIFLRLTHATSPVEYGLQYQSFGRTKVQKGPSKGIKSEE